jgi:phosphate-selective porin OprO/OprP
MNTLTIHRVLSICILFHASILIPATATSQQSNFDQLWNRANWTASSNDTLVQRAQFTGRMQVDFPLLDSNIGSHSDLTIRRFRAGGKLFLPHKITLHAEAEFDPEQAEPFFKRLTDTYLMWSLDPRFVLIVGKQSAAFTMDGQTSSKELLAIDRSALANNLWFPEEYIPGITINGRQRNWLYLTGLYSSGEANRDFGDFSGGAFWLATIGHDFSGVFDVKEAILRVNFVHNQPDTANTFTRQLKNIASINFSYANNVWGVRADVSAAEGYLGQPNLFGLMFMPLYNLTDKWQLVGRLTRVESEDDNGVRFGRYESSLTGGRGDRYHEAYLGVNYYIYGHKLKIQSGLQHAHMRDRAEDGGHYSGWSWTGGLRVSW